MNRGQLLTSAACGIVAAAGLTPAPAKADSLSPPKEGPLVAFVLGPDSTIIDFAGPWEVFQDAQVPGRAAFNLYTVAETTRPIEVSAGAKLVPSFDLTNAPPPKVVVPAVWPFTGLAAKLTN